MRSTAYFTPPYPLADLAVIPSAVPRPSLALAAAPGGMAEMRVTVGGPALSSR